MSEKEDTVFADLLPAIVELEKDYEKISSVDPVARGHIGRQILELIDSSDVATEYLRHCEHQANRDLSEPARSRIESMIRIINSRGVMF